MEHHKQPVVGLGQASIDFLGTLAEFPAPDEKCELTGLSVQGGGPAATALVTLARLGVPTAMIGVIGDDHFGPQIRHELLDEGVDAARLITIPGTRSQYAFIAIDENKATRTIFWRRTSAELTLTAADLHLIKQSSLLHLDGLMIDASLTAAQTARLSGRPVVYDAGSLRPGSLDLAANSDYLICSEKFMTAYNPSGDLEQGLVRLKNLGPRQTVVTLGDKGSLGFDGRDFHHQKSFKVTALDTTGAGDVYHGAYIYGLLQNWSMPECMALASAVAAMKCLAVGGRTGIPTLEKVEVFMGDNYPGK